MITKLSLLTRKMLVLPALNEKLGTPNPGKREGCPILSNFSFGEIPRSMLQNFVRKSWGKKLTVKTGLKAHTVKFTAASTSDGIY